MTPTADFNLTALMERDEIISVRRIQTVQGQYFEVVTNNGRGLGMTVGAALEKAQPVQVAA